MGETPLEQRVKYAHTFKAERTRNMVLPWGPALRCHWDTPPHTHTMLTEGQRARRAETEARRACVGVYLKLYNKQIKEDQTAKQRNQLELQFTP